jgi:hypothetical protein
MEKTSENKTAGPLVAAGLVTHLGLGQAARFT